MKEVGPYLCEVMFVLSVEDHNVESLKVTGAHFKTDSYVLRTDGTTFGHNMSGAKPLDLADPAQLGLIEPLNAAVIAELNQVKTQLNVANDTGQALEKEHKELVEKFNRLSEENIISLQELDGTRIQLKSKATEIEALSGEYAELDRIFNQSLQDKDREYNELLSKYQNLLEIGK